MANEQARRGAAVASRRPAEDDRGPSIDRVSAVEREGDALIAAVAFADHLDRAEGGRFNLDVELLDGGDEDVTAIGLAAQNGREQADHRGAPDWLSVMIPGAVARDAHPEFAAALGVPSLDRRQAALLDQLLKLVEADPLKLDRWAALRHGLH